MTFGPRAKLLLLFSLFVLPMVASFIAYKFVRPEATANYGELLLPPATITKQPFNRLDGGGFVFRELEGRWALVTSDSGACAAPCAEKLAAMRQVRIALGRNATRVERIFVVDDLQAPSPAALAPFDGTIVAVTRPGLQLPAGAVNDRAHIYLVDPRGNVMMRWPATAQLPRMKKDLDRLLKASQIG
jgi:hypothetical protein